MLKKQVGYFNVFVLFSLFIFYLLISLLERLIQPNKHLHVLIILVKIKFLTYFSSVQSNKVYIN